MPREDCFLFWEMRCEERWQGGGGLAFLKGKRGIRSCRQQINRFPFLPFLPFPLPPCGSSITSRKKGRASLGVVWGTVKGD